MNITLTGATGFIGRRLVRRLLDDGHSLRTLARRPADGLEGDVRFFRWDAIEDSVPEESVAGADAVIHLAGEPVSQRWTAEAKERIRRSRLDGTRRMVEALSVLSRRPSVLISASAIGYYGDRDGEVLTEMSLPGDGFLPELCVEWEHMADLAQALGIRVVKVRIGLVLGREGGALSQMLTPFKFGVGGRLGSGKQWMSWIHLNDVVELFLWAMESQDLHGPVNGTAPQPVTNEVFTRDLAETLHRPAVMAVPKLALKVMYGEMADVILQSQRVLPRVAQTAGFRYRFPELGGALQDLLGAE
ncbi:MAG: TIGR01777 family oxidoreductase [Bryobacteraceae bacterium]